jgi:large subunit ribosomal protein L20
MPRVKRGIQTHKRHASLLELAKGYRTGRNNLYKRASEAVMQAGQFAYRDRRTKKRDLRRGWITRINAAVREHGMTYSAFMNALRTQDTALNRKMLAELAIMHPDALETLVKNVQKDQ